jgi:hypothetical protein
MKYIFSLLGIFLFWGMQSAVGQTVDLEKAKIKVKKGKVFVNDSVWATCESKGSFFKGHQYYFKTLDGKPLISILQGNASSLFKDSSYVYTRVVFHPKELTSSMEEDELLVNSSVETTVAKLLVKKYKLLAKNDLSEEGYQRFVKVNPDTVPERVKALWSYQKTLMKETGYLLPRNEKEAVRVEAFQGTCFRHPDDWFRTRCFAIYQDNQYLGFAKYDVYRTDIAAVSAESDRCSLELFNSKGSKVGSYMDMGHMGGQGTFPTLCSAQKLTRLFNVEVPASLKNARNDGATLTAALAQYFISLKEL